METIAQFAIGFVNSAFEDPLSAARWWSTVQPLPSGLVVRAGQKPRFDSSLLSELVALRASARRFAAGQELHSDAAVLDRALWGGTPCVLPSESGWRQGFAAGDGASAVLFPAALACVQLLFSSQRGRLRRCANAECTLFFLDETKNGSRRWCKLSCMERERAPRRRLRR